MISASLFVYATLHLAGQIDVLVTRSNEGQAVVTAELLRLFIPLLGYLFAFKFAQRGRAIGGYLDTVANESDAPRQ